jgi:hypothetical protein
MAAPTNALSPQSILDYISKSLPTAPPPKNPYSAIAIFSHACMLAVGFRLIGLGEDHRIGKWEASFRRFPILTTLVEAQSNPGNVQPLPSEWDASSTYAFRYAHSQSSMEYLVKISRLGTKALIFGVALGDDRTASFEVKAQDYVSEESLKGPPDSPSGSKIQDIFISPERMTDLSSLFRQNIIQKLAPGIQKEGYEDNTSTAAQQRREETRQPQEPQHNPLRDDREPPARPYPFDDPLAAAPRRPVPVGEFAPPGFEDEYEMQRPPRGMPAGFGGRNPLAIGDRDLYPPGLGPNDPLRVGPGGGFGGGGGMHPTFDDPLFGGQAGGQPYDPRAPPGARYDPIGPGDVPPNVRGGPRFPGGRGGGFGGNPFGGFGSNDFI